MYQTKKLDQNNKRSDPEYMRLISGEWEEDLEQKGDDARVT